jgi:hypothetical protein
MQEHVFDNQSEWFRHETASHRLEWSCNIETHPSYDQMHEFLDHMKEHHHDLLHANQLPGLKRIFQRSTRSNTGVCNLCGELSDKLRSHISKHLKQLALFALPQTDYMAETDTEDTKSDLAHRSRDISMKSESSGELASEAIANTTGAHEGDDGMKSDDLEPEEAAETMEQLSEETSWDYATSKFKDARDAMQDNSMTRASLSKENMSGQGSVAQDHNSDMAVINPYYQQRPQCGASIGAFRGEHLPPISLGGIILVDGEPFGLTVHHLLDAPSDDESEDEDPEATDMDKNVPVVRSIGSDMNSSAHEPWDLALEQDTHSAPVTDEETFSSSSESDNDETDTDQSAIGDVIGISPGEGKDIIVTQPAIDDVDDSFWSSESSKDQEHLEAHRLGYIHASSGIRRWKRHGILHEVDWALIKIDPERLQPYNVVSGGWRFRRGPPDRDPPPLEQPAFQKHYGLEENEYPTEVADADSLGGKAVHCFARTTGLQGGTIGLTMGSVRIYQRKTKSKSWYVDGGCKYENRLDDDQGANILFQSAWVETPERGSLIMMAVSAASS